MRVIKFDDSNNHKVDTINHFLRQNAILKGCTFGEAEESSVRQNFALLHLINETLIVTRMHRHQK